VESHAGRVFFAGDSGYGPPFRRDPQAPGRTRYRAAADRRL
jgi:hypothetical protein